MRPLALRNILLATDLTPEMIPALQSARELAHLSGATLHVVHAVEEPSRRADVNRRWSDMLAGTSGGLDLTVLVGPAGALVTQEAARVEADVVVLGRHRGRRGMPGSTADQVVRSARVPCLILPGNLPLPLASVLVPVDITQAARGALAVGLTWASALRRRVPRDSGTPTRLDILHVQPPDPRDEAAALRHLNEEVAHIADRLAGIAGIAIEKRVESSADVPGAIMQDAGARKPDLIVLGTRARPLAEAPLGSVSSAVVRQSSLPILLVPPEVWESDAAEIPD